jgi:hypothetical protein
MEPSNFLDITIKFKNKIQKNIQRKLQITWKSFEGSSWPSSWKKILKYFEENFKFLFERFEPTFFLKKQNFPDPC